MSSIAPAGFTARTECKRLRAAALRRCAAGRRRDTGFAIDRFGFRHSGAGHSAIADFERAVHALAAHRTHASVALGDALQVDSSLTAAHALAGFGQVLLARAELIEPAARCLSRAQSALLSRGGSPDEVALVEGLALAVAGRFGDSARRLALALAENPDAFLPMKIAYALRFMIGDAAGMLAMTTDALAAGTPAFAGRGYLLGCHAFALEENGRFAEAEFVGRQAVSMQPDDAWGMHAVSHVHEMQGRVDAGIAWLETTRPVWSRCNNFSFHMAWHLALFHLETGDHARTLDIYDREVRPRPSEDFRDVANAASLLWRVRQEGVAVGDRWQELRDIATRRRSDTTLGFATLHHLMACLAKGDLATARDIRQAMSTRDGASDTATAVRGVAGDVADVMIERAEGTRARTDYADIQRRLPALGGSHAQRDVFVRILAEAAAVRNDSPALVRLLAARRRLKREDRFARAFDRPLAIAA